MKRKVNFLDNMDFRKRKEVCEEKGMKYMRKKEGSIWGKRKEVCEEKGRKYMRKKEGSIWGKLETGVAWNKAREGDMLTNINNPTKWSKNDF